MFPLMNPQPSYKPLGCCRNRYWKTTHLFVNSSEYSEVENALGGSSEHPGHFLNTDF
jgi:hypothetical protein